MNKVLIYCLAKHYNYLTLIMLFCYSLSQKECPHAPQRPHDKARKNTPAGEVKYFFPKKREKNDNYLL